MCHLTTLMARYHGTAGVARPAMSRNNASIRLCDRTLLLPATQASTELLICTAVVVVVVEKCDKPWRRRVLFFHFENKPEALFCFCAWHPILHDYVVDGKVKKKKSFQHLLMTCSTWNKCIIICIYFMHISCITHNFTVDLAFLILPFTPTAQYTLIELPCIACNITSIDQLELGCG